ncbi:MAG TPA: hypothetical protein VGJ15_09680 [Pirellulales bacterium]|jgi:predicted GH43/DUF377 family glycosyl hydrolase
MFKLPKRLIRISFLSLASLLVLQPLLHAQDARPVNPAKTDAAKTDQAKANESAFVDDVVSQAALDRIYAEVKTPFKYGVVIPREGEEWIDCPSVYRFNDHWYMLYVRYTPKLGYESMLARSDDLLHWKTLGPILPFRKEGWDAWQADAGMALVDPTWGGSAAPEKFDGKYWCSYIGGALQGMEPDPLSTGIAWTEKPDQAGEWHRIGENPVLSGSDADARPWEKTTVFKTSIIRDPKQRFGAPFLMYYNARTKPTLESIGMAISSDMIHWKRFGPQEALVLNPDNGRGTGISGDPQLVQMQVETADDANGTQSVKRNVWVMFYFGFRWAGPGAFDTFAASYDLLHWTKWRGDHLVQPSAKTETTTFDKTFAHKPWVLKHDGVVYHFYCSVGEGGRQIAVATSKDLKGQ